MAFLTSAVFRASSLVSGLDSRWDVVCSLCLAVLSWAELLDASVEKKNQGPERRFSN